MSSVTVRTFRDLIVWQKSIDLAVQVYALAARLPSAEKCGLGSQLTRASGSISANIAEGTGRSSTRDYANFLSISRGSLMETESFLLLAVRLDFLADGSITEAISLCREVDRMLCGLRNKLLQQSATSTRPSSNPDSDS